MMKSPLLFSLLLGSYSVLSFHQNQREDKPKNFTIENCVNEFSLAQVESTRAGYQYWFIDKDFLDGRTLKMSVVKPREATYPPHQHPEDEFFFVLEGKAEFYLDGKTKVAEPYASFYCPPNVEHGIRNVGDTILKYLVIKKYEKK